MKKILSILLLIAAIVAMPQILTSCGHDEPDTPVIPEPDSDHNKPDDPTEGEDIPGEKILGTWYYMTPDRAIKITIRFTQEKSSLFDYFGSRVCYISVESEFPYYRDDYDNSWTYSNSEWSITRVEVLNGFSASAKISKVFDDEMWLGFEYGQNTKTLKFKRSDPGSPVKPLNKQLAPDGIWGRYVWKASIGRYNMTFQFTGPESTKETSDAEVLVIIDGVVKRLKEFNGEARFSAGLLKLDWNGSLISSEVGHSYFIVTKETDRKLILYSPFTPDITYTFTR